MPTLMLRGLPPALMSRLSAYAARVGLGRAEAAARLIDAGLRASERASVAGKLRASSRTPESQQAASRARWDKPREPS